MWRTIKQNSLFHFTLYFIPYILGHAPNLIRKNNRRGLHNMSEEGSEGSHKVLKQIREHGARKTSLEENLFDSFRKMHFISDATIRDLRRKLYCSKCFANDHTIRSCPKVKEKEKSDDDVIFENLIRRVNEVDDPQNIVQI